MNYLATITCFALFAGPVSAQENRLPQEEARKYAKLCVEQAGKLSDAPITMEVDPENPCAERGEGGGAMIVPDKKLSREVLTRVGKDVIPIGQLWLRKWTLVVNGKSLPDNQLRIVNVNIDDNNRPMRVFWLGVRKKNGKEIGLVVYARDKKSLQVLPLQKLDLIPKLPLELEWQRGEKQVDPLTLRILGRHQAVLTVIRQGP